MNAADEHKKAPAPLREPALMLRLMLGPMPER
jgi:hypothetical protein